MSKNTHGPAFPVAAGHEVYSSGMTLAFNDNREADALRDIGTDFHELVREATVWKHGKPHESRASYYAALRAGRHVVQHIFRLFPDLRDEALKGEIR